MFIQKNILEINFCGAAVFKCTDSKVQQNCGCLDTLLDLLQFMAHTYKGLLAICGLPIIPRFNCHVITCFFLYFSFFIALYALTYFGIKSWQHFLNTGSIVISIFLKTDCVKRFDF